MAGRQEGTAVDSRTHTSNLHVSGFQPLIAPDELLAELPLSESQAATVHDSREAVRRILAGDDDRLLTIVGPCSVHDVNAAVDYATRLAKTAADTEDELCVVMRVYFEKPRTTVGWKGLINDPGMDGSHDVHRGLRTARRLLLDVLDLGLPVGCEFLDPELAPVHRRRGQLGRDRRPHHGKPGPPSAGLGSFDAGGVQERHERERERRRRRLSRRARGSRVLRP